MPRVLPPGHIEELFLLGLGLRWFQLLFLGNLTEFSLKFGGRRFSVCQFDSYFQDKFEN